MSMLNANIKKRRTKLGLTLQDVGDAVGVTRATIQRYESGEIANIDTKMIEKLATALQCTPSQLMGWEKFPISNNKKLDELFTLCVQMDDDQLQTIIDVVYNISKSWGNR